MLCVCESDSRPHGKNILDIFIILTCTILLHVFLRSYFSLYNVYWSLKKHISSTEISKKKPPIPHYLFPSPSPHLNSDIKNQENEINQSITTSITTNEKKNHYFWNKCKNISIKAHKSTSHFYFQIGIMLPALHKEKTLGETYLSNLSLKK